MCSNHFIFVERDDPKIVGDGIGKRAPLEGQCFAKEEVVLDFRPVCSLVKVDLGFI